MTSKPKLLLSLYWHMHQPDYRDSITGEYVLPWTYLHAIKDYCDMIYHIEANPQAKVSFNFVPILLDQLENYVEQFNSGKLAHIKDPILRLLGTPDLNNISHNERRLIKESCFKNYHEKMLQPFPHYTRLYQICLLLQQDGYDGLNYLSHQYLADLLVWYHLAWMGESVRRNAPLVGQLMTKGNQFSWEERHALFQLIGELICNLIPRYKRLAKTDQIEISSTPHHHPILPLLLDFKVTHDAMPYAPLPKHAVYPDGKARAIAHLQDAQHSHQRRFSHLPKGMWPSEGAVSKASLLLMAEQGVTWAASGEGVLANSLMKSFPQQVIHSRQDYLYQPYVVQDGAHSIVCFFRNDRLSDKIGFEYQKMHSTEAVADFIRDLEQIYHANNTENNPVVSVILDGENAWEYYPYNGYYFLTELYQMLTQHAFIQMITPSEILALLNKPEDAGFKISCPILPDICSGSWVYGTLSTWIGSDAKNRGWELLCEAKMAYDQVVAENRLSPEALQQCEEQLSVCEGSDWFWWLGDENGSHQCE